MRPSLQRAALLGALLLVLPFRLASQELRSTRPIEVPEPGWVRVPLDPEILRRAVPSGGHVRLFGPDGGEVPFRRVALEEEAAQDRALSVTMVRPECRRLEEETAAVGPRTVCPLPLGSAGRLLRRLDLTVEADEPVGYRLLSPRAGRWDLVAEGVWESPLPETPHSIDLELTLPDPAEPLRLELYGGDAPEVVRAGAEMGAEALLFEARRAGRHTLTYGPGVFRSSRSEDVEPPPGVEPQWIRPGPEETGEAAPGAAPLPESAGPAPSVRFEREWRLTADAPTAGTVHRLSVEAPVYAVADAGLGDVRLLAGDLQVPYVRWRPAQPTAVLAVHGVPPVSDPSDRADSAGGERLRVELELERDLDAARLPLSALVLHAGQDRVRARVRLVAPEPGLAGAVGGDRAPRASTPWTDWSCDRLPPCSCRLVVPLSGAAGSDGWEQALARTEEPVRRLVLEIESTERGAAGEASEGPGPLDVELLAHRDVLLFPWPSGDRAPRLTAGAEDLGPPGYDLEERRDEILARPWHRAELVPAGEEDPDGGWVGHVTVGLTLASALALLLLLLHGILAARDPAGPR